MSYYSLDDKLESAYKQAIRIYKREHIMDDDRKVRVGIFRTCMRKESIPPSIYHRPIWDDACILKSKKFCIHYIDSETYDWLESAVQKILLNNPEFEQEDEYEVINSMKCDIKLAQSRIGCFKEINKRSEELLEKFYEVFSNGR